MRRRASLLAGAIALTGCSAYSPATTPAELPGEAIVYVVGRGWHTDITLPVDEIAGPLGGLEKTFPGVRFLSFGFGERQFLLSRHRSMPEMLGALLPSPSALLVTALSATPEAAFGVQHVVVLHVSTRGLRQIESRLWNEFEDSRMGELTPIAPGPYPGSLFYAARDTYDGFNTCNTWTAEMLHAAGLPMSSGGVLFASQVMGVARRMAAQQASMRHG